MKKMLLALFVLSSLFGLAQEKVSPEIKKGTKLQYLALANGQEIPLIVSIDSLHPEFVRMKWTIEGYGDGSWSMKKKSLESGKRGAWEEPQTGIDTEMAEDQTVLLFSKASWDQMKNNQPVLFDDHSFTVKQPNEQQLIKMNGKQVDAILLENEGGSSRIWILNNPSFPAILKVEGNIHGVDLVIQNIE